MAEQLRFSLEAAQAGLNAIVDVMDGGGGGKLIIYDGTQPADPDAAPGATALVTFTLANPAFDASTDGTTYATAGVADASLPLSVAASNSGTATWFRFTKPNGTTGVIDGSVGLATADLILDAVVIGAGATVTITDLNIRLPQTEAGA